MRVLFLIAGGPASAPSTVAATLGRLSASASARATSPAAIVATLGRIGASGAGPAASPAYASATLGKLSASASATAGAANGGTPTTFEQDLSAYLRTNLGVLVYPKHIPEDVPLPAACYSRISAEREAGMAGPNGIVNARYQISFASTVYQEASDLADAISNGANGLHGFTNRMMGGTKVFYARRDDDPVDYADPVDDSDEGTYQIDCEYVISYREPINRLS